MAGAVCFTCNKGNAIKIANMGRDMPPTFLRARTEALQTARPLSGPEAELSAVGPTFSDFTILDQWCVCDDDELMKKKRKGGRTCATTIEFLKFITWNANEKRSIVSRTDSFS